MKCYQCGITVEGTTIGFNEYCAKCGFDLHCCRMCQFHDRNYNNECRESSADRVVDKQKRNHCDYFKAAEKEGGSISPDSLKSAADALFKKKS